MKVSAAVLKATAGDSAKSQSMVGGTLDLASLNRSDNYAGALGQLLQVQSLVRSTDPSEFAKNIGPGLAAAAIEGQNQQGLTTEQSLEYASVISQILKDQTGANTSTALRQFITRMDSFMPKQSEKMTDGTVAKLTQEQIDTFRNTRTVEERIELMRQIPALGQQFLKTQKEGIGKVAVREIVQGTPTARDLEQRARDGITSLGTAQSILAAHTKELERHTIHLRATRRAQATLEANRIGGTRATSGTVIQAVDSTLDDVDLSGLDWETRKKIRGMVTESIQGTESFNEGIAALEEAKHQRKIFGLIPAGGEVSREDRNKIDMQIEILKQIRDEMQQANRQRPQQPKMRPKVDPLPAATMP